ncbi:O-antigen ligase [Microvirga sp. VF16]|uniref:O-antigen ligase family protein n=1 Tax=Microvirga sp. VF16 TaxID=2807101 RepID=UPI00193E4FEB|nr:O-antigen ligase family protein [Microvirga sp. VF16]QRM30972.1 O-antigen ligase family protein [Microvirga sp. VF16]
MAVANRSSPLFLACAALFVLASRLASGAIGSYRAVLAGQRTGVLILVLCAAAYPLISLSWAMRPALGLFAWGEAVLPAVSSATLIVSWRAAPPPRWMVGALARTMLIAAGLIAAELLLDFPLRRFLPERIGTFIHNRPVVTLFLLLGPVLVLVGFHRQRALFLGLLLGIVATIIVSDSEAAKLGLLAAAGTFALSYAPFVWVKRFLTVVLLGLIWIQPFFGNAVASLVPDKAIEATKGGHSRERIELWQAFSDVARHYPIFGTGFASSPHMGSHPVAAEINPAYRQMLKVGHPHNAFLQAWVELGAIGAVLLSALVLWVLKSLSGAPADIRRAGLMTLMSTSAIALVSHGAWQGWWIAAIALATAFLTLDPSHSRPRD